MRPLLLLLCLLGALLGCSRAEAVPHLVVDADGTRRLLPLPTEGEATVGELLAAAGIAVGPADRLDPPSVTLATPGLAVRLIRVRTREVQEERLLAFAREVRRDASLPQGDSRAAQLGENGRERLTYRLVLEDGVEVSRELVSRETIQPPTTEILIVGTRGSGEGVPFRGSIAYLEQGNAWLMRGDSAQKRALTRTGDLDGHVFALSPDGRWLLFTRRPLGGASGQGGPLNTLWLADTTVTNDEPRPLEIESVLWAGWHPCDGGAADCPLRLAYSTAQRVPTAPGWSAHNDLWRVDFDALGNRTPPDNVLPASSGLLGWWGRSWAWSPDGTRLAWADASRVGLLSLEDGSERVLGEFLPFETGEAWVWTPQVAWAENGQALYLTRHEATPERAADLARVPRFDLWRYDLESQRAERLIPSVGPFAMPRLLDENRLLYAQVEDPTLGLTSRYRLWLRSRAGDSRALFPPDDQPGLDVAWTAFDEQDQALIAVWQGDLYLVPLVPMLPARALTAEGGASRPQWGR